MSCLQKILESYNSDAISYKHEQNLWISLLGLCLNDPVSFLRVFICRVLALCIFLS